MKKNLLLLFLLTFSIAIWAQKAVVKTGVSSTFLSIDDETGFFNGFLTGVDVGLEASISKYWTIETKVLFQGSGKYEKTGGVFVQNRFISGTVTQRDRLSVLSVNFFRYPDGLFDGFYYGFGVGFGQKSTRILAPKNVLGNTPKGLQTTVAPIGGTLGYKAQISDKLLLDQFARLSVVGSKDNGLIGVALEVGCMINLIK